ncbi:MAG: hypothetical protein ACYC21_15055 [Eubacteriales bacterium]
MLESSLIYKYAKYGYLSPCGELYLPINRGKELIKECDKLKIAVIGLEFFHLKGNNIVPVNPIKGIDCSPLLRQYTTWDAVVFNCNDMVLEVLKQEEKMDSNQYFNPTIIEEAGWK